MASDELEGVSVPPPASIEPPAADVLLRGLVPPYRLGAMLLRIAELKLTGQLSLGSDVGRRTIYFHTGFPVFSESSLFGERLGAVGVRHGLLKRDDIARALTYARQRSCGLGLALLELGRVDAAGLFGLLGVQLREVVAAACGSEPLRARFQNGRAALRNAMIFRLHPLTAVLTAVSALPAEEQAKLLSAVGSRSLLDTAIPLLAQQWLTDLGYLGELERLCTGAPSVSALRTRLSARQRPGAEKCFDPAEVAFSLPVARDAVVKLTPEKIAELVTLTLLLSGSLKLTDATTDSRFGAGASSAQGASSLQRSLEDAVEHPLREIRTATGSGEGDADRAIEEYLTSGREPTLAAAAAVWGPSVEARDAALAPELMKLYLTLKPEKRPLQVLDLEPSPSRVEISQAYARRVELLSSLTRPDPTPHLRCRTAELLQCFDDALVRLSIGNGSSGAISESAAPAPDLGLEPSRNSVPPAARVTDPGMTSAPVGASLLPPPRSDIDAIGSKVEALMRVSNWNGVLETLDAHGADPALPFSLRLARAMAQRELEPRLPAPRGKRWIGAFALGLGLGIALSQVLGPWLGALFRR